MIFKEYNGLDLVAIAEQVLERWKKLSAFETSLKLREGAPEFIFFEGPPSANGMPGIHHVMARSIKDAVCRYKTQSGYKVRRRAGWDTHGLPVELGVEKKLGITKEDIGKKITVEDYNRTCGPLPSVSVIGWIWTILISRMTTVISRPCGGFSRTYTVRDISTKASLSSHTLRLPVPD